MRVNHIAMFQNHGDTIRQPDSFHFPDQCIAIKVQCHLHPVACFRSGQLSKRQQFSAWLLTRRTSLFGKADQ